ncbi:unnamed protein product [Closterium sp. Naga37s-1]|nr:unnamed protein product [Closterium sp. Naga37s-1]
MSASGNDALKPPVPPAPKPAPAVAVDSASPAPDLVSCEAPAPLLPAPSAPVAEPGLPAGPAPSAPGPPAVPVESAGPPAVAEPGVAPLVPELLAALPAVAVPVAPDAAVGSSPMAVSATTCGPGPNVAPAGAVQAAPVAAPVGQQPGQRSSRPHSPAPPPAAPPPVVPPVTVAPSRPAVAPVPLASAQAPSVPAASAAVRDRRLRLPQVPPVAGLEFVTAAGGAVTAQYPPLLAADPAPPSVLDAPLLPTLPGPPRMAEVPEASLAQMWRLCEALQAIHLIQVYGHAALFQGNSLDGGPRDECLDAADRLAELLAPVLAAPVRGVIAGVGQLGTAVRGLKRVLRAGTGDEVIGASAAVVRELHRSQTGLLAVHDADQY